MNKLNLKEKNIYLFSAKNREGNFLRIQEAKEGISLEDKVSKCHKLHINCR